MEAHSPEVRQHSGDALLQRYQGVRAHTEEICSGLQTEDFVVQPVPDVSPPKWHLGHSTWFFETFILVPHAAGYKRYHPDYHFIFNSYYESLGERVLRPMRGNLSRPTVHDIYAYRKHVDQAMAQFLPGTGNEIHELLELGLQHEQQHQELLQTDIKFILGHNPLFPPYRPGPGENTQQREPKGYHRLEAGLYHIGHSGPGFCFDNELGFHDVYLDGCSISTSLVTNGEYLEFLNGYGYRNHEYWLSEGWDLVKQGVLNKPLYWHKQKDTWLEYTHHGLAPINRDAPLAHISYYEASAFAQWRGKRLPTEFEWEAASDHFEWGERWEWTASAYLPYPGFKRLKGALGEYNGKFMINQMVLRGASAATPRGHSRKTYRNFFHPHLQWQFSGIRLCE